MQETRVSIQADDRSSVIASFFLGVATTLFIVMYWFVFQNVLLFSFFSLVTLIIFLAITILLTQPKHTKKVVRIAKLEPLKVEELKKEEPKKELIKDKYVGSTQTKVYHNASCRLAKLIKPKFKISSNDKSFFKNYKECKICLKK
jgi:predicted membrane protein